MDNYLGQNTIKLGGLNVKKYVALMLAAFMAVAVLAGCSGGEKVPQVYYAVYSGEVTTINYLTTSSENEFGLAANLVDTLVDYDNLGRIQPCLATEWSVDAAGLNWTFKIREDVKWYTHEGKEYADVKAQDWVDALKYIFTASNESSTANVAYRVIKNAEAYYNEEITDFSQVGVKATDDHTLVFTLEKPVPYFLSMLNYSVFFPVNGDFLAEKGDRFGTDNTNLLYNGAFILETFEHQNRRILVKNKNYWDAKNVHIEKLDYQYNAEAAALAPEMYLRGEITDVAIPSTSIKEWMDDPVKKEMVRPGRPSSYTYFYAFNFDPKFDAQYDPANWKVAVNNTNFRKSLFHGLNRIAAQQTAEPYFPERKLNFTITPYNFVSHEGKDFTQFGKLAQISQTEPFNADLALEFKELALAELEGKATFPVKVVMPYNTGGTEWTQRVQVIEQQMETLLGKDYIDIVPLPHPPTGFLDGTRRNGNYSFQEVNWGPDYADPETYTDPFARGGTYNFPEYTTEVNADGENLFDVYEALLNEAKAEVVNIERRFELFAEAEAMLIENAWVMPYGLGGGGYVSSKLNPFESPYSPFGVSYLRWKGQKVREEAMSPSEYEDELAKWEEARKNN